MLGVVVSRADEASEHIGERLRAIAEWTADEDDARPAEAGGGVVYRTPGAELRTFDGLHIELDRPDVPFDEPDLLVFVSRHAGETGPLLTAHHTGNVGPAEYGGEPERLAVAAPGALSAALERFDTLAPDGYDVSLECTHHGPTALEVPSLFVEVGSAPAQWRDDDAATVAARTVLALRWVDPAVERAFVGFGGGHYAPRFTRIVRETDWHVGHVVADWGLSSMGEPDPPLLERVFERSGARYAVIDGERPALADAIEALGYRVVGETFLRATTAVPLAVVERAERTLVPVDDGLRFGQAAGVDSPTAELVVIDPPDELLSDANGVDQTRVRSAVAADAVAYETVESGNRVAGRVAVPTGEAWRRIETSLVGLLEARFDEVTVRPDEIVVRDRTFDPDRARSLGVDPGPAFGRLAAGESVTVDGRTVEPETVHVVREKRYPRA